MEKIASFCVDHNTLDPGMYTSRIDGDITTYDLRFIKPNTPPFLPNPVMHTIEHLFATYSRNSRFGKNIVYFGPMGCRTGFYLLVRSLTPHDAINLVLETVTNCISHTGDIPGNSAKECGNWLEHDISGANQALEHYYNLLKNWKIENLQY